MARPRKNAPKPNTQELALVPVEEQPYPLPEGWKWVRLGSIADILNGFMFKSEKYVTEGIRIIRISNVQDGFLEDDKPVFYPLSEHQEIEKFMLSPYDLLISLTGNVGRTAIIYNNLLPAAVNQRVLRVRIKNRTLLNYIFYFTQRKQFQNECIANSKGSAQLNLSSSYINSLAIPVPPLDEQERIVTGIESLFAKLDEAREKAEAVLDSYEARKAAILHKAFTGELTVKWREEKGVTKESWKNVTVGEICHDVKVGIVIKPSQYYTDQSQGTPAFRSANVRENHIDNFDWVYLNSEGMTINKRSIVHTGDVLVVRSGNPGTACVVTEEFDGYNAIDILIAVPDQSKVIPQYLCSFTNSPLGKKSVAAGKRGMALAHFNVKGYSALALELPTIPEQQEITRILDSLLEKEQQSKEAAETVLEQIDLMKKAILAKAFRGELG